MTAVPGLGGRREAREEALALLYEVDSTGATVADALAARSVAPGDYAVDLASGVVDRQDELDAVIGRHLTGWRLERLAVVDRTLVRMATWELDERPEIPTGVVLSEAVALATQYSGEDSPKFVNGLLRAVADEVRGPEPA